MKLAVSMSVAALGAAILVAPGAQAAESTPVSIVIPACSQSSPVSEALLPSCSYVALPREGGGASYANLTSGGDITMTGSLTSGRLSLPASGQNWPGLAVAGGLASVQVTKSEITGTLDASGAVVLSVPYEATISAGLLGSCSVKGTATMSSAAIDPIGGGQGSAYDPISNSFAVAGASSSPPVLSGNLCELAGDYIDPARGFGWYLNGSLALNATTSVTLAQTASVELPARIKRKGRTVLLRRPVVTSADQVAAATITWGTKRSARGGNRKQARVTSKAGRVAIRTTGKAKRLFVRLTLRAPATQGYRAYRSTRVWVVR